MAYGEKMKLVDTGGVNELVINASGQLKALVTQDGTWNVGITGTVPLPTGAATEATLASVDTRLTDVQGRINAVAINDTSWSIFHLVMGGYNKNSTSNLAVTVAEDNNDANTHLMVIGGNDFANKSKYYNASMLPLTNANALVTTLVDGSGNQITSFGGGAEFLLNDAYSSGADKGKLLMAIADWSPGSGTYTSGADGKMQPIVSSKEAGALFVEPIFGNTRLASASTGSGNALVVYIGGAGTAIGASQSGNWNVGMQDGSFNNITSHLAGASRGIDVSIIDGSGNQITSFGGGTQYTEGDTDATITGTALMWEDAADTLRAVSASKPLPVDIKNSTLAVTQSGTWNINNVSGTISLPTGAATEATLGNVLTTTAFQARINTLGQKTMANSTPVVLSSDQSAIPVTDNGGSITVDGTVAFSNTTIAVTNTGTFAVQAAQSGNWSVRMQDGTGNALTSSAGALDVFVANTAITIVQATAANLNATVVGTGTFAVQESGAALTSLQLLDDVVVTAGSAALTKGYQVAGTDGTNARILKTNTSGQLDIRALTSGDQITIANSSLAVTQSGNWAVRLQDGSGNTLNSTSNALNVSVQNASLAVTQSGSWSVTADTELPAAAALGDSTANPTTTSVGAFGHIYNGSNWDRLRSVNAANALTDGTSVGIQAAGNGPGHSRVDSSQSITANSQSKTFNTKGTEQLCIMLTGTWSGTVTFEYSTDGGTTWTTDNTGINASTLYNTSGVETANGTWFFDSSATTLYRVRSTAWTSGTLNIIFIGSLGQALMYGPIIAPRPDRISVAQTWKSANYTTTQTGTAMWTPASGKKIALQHISISAYGTTAGRVIIWYGASGDTTYTAGTDQLVWAGSFAPSTTAKPMIAIPFPNNCPAVANTADYVLRITTDAAISLDIAMYGYEF